MYLEKQLNVARGPSACVLDAGKHCTGSTNAVGKPVSSAFAVQMSGCFIQLGKLGFLWLC